MPLKEKRTAAKDISEKESTNTYEVSSTSTDTVTTSSAHNEFEEDEEMYEAIKQRSTKEWQKILDERVRYHTQKAAFACENCHRRPLQKDDPVDLHEKQDGLWLPVKYQTDMDKSASLFFYGFIILSKKRMQN